MCLAGRSACGPAEDLGDAAKGRPPPAAACRASDLHTRDSTARLRGPCPEERAYTRRARQRVANHSVYPVEAVAVVAHNPHPPVRRDDPIVLGTPRVDGDVHAGDRALRRRGVDRGFGEPHKSHRVFDARRLARMIGAESELTIAPLRSVSALPAK